VRRKGCPRAAWQVLPFPGGLGHCFCLLLNAPFALTEASYDPDVDGGALVHSDRMWPGGGAEARLQSLHAGVISDDADKQSVALL